MKVSNADPVASSGPPGLVIFDCDGVIVDSERLIVQVESELISAEGWQLSPAEVARLFLGTSDDYMYREIERTIGRPLGEKWKRNLSRMRDVSPSPSRPYRELPPYWTGST